MFIFPIILFDDSTGDAIMNPLIPIHQSHFVELLVRFVSANCSSDLAAIRLGVALEIPYHFINI